MEFDKMMLTVIIPAKNEAKYIKKCIESLGNAIQKWGGKAEIILVDNGSKDTTKQIAEAKGCLVIEQLEGTISKLRNIGAKNARGNIMAFLDADCLVSPDWISFCLENFSDHTIAATGTRAVPDLERATWVEKAWYRLVSGAIRPDLVEWLGTSNLFVRKEVFSQIGGFDENLETGEDVDLCYRIGENYQIYLEKRINTIHLRESKTLKELFKREFWRGKSSLKTFKESNFSKKELPSVVVPAINFFSMILLLILGAMRSSYIFIPLIIIFLFPVLFMIKKKVKTDLPIETMECYIVAFVYIGARSCSLFYELFENIKELMG